MLFWYVPEGLLSVVFDSTLLLSGVRTLENKSLTKPTRRRGYRTCVQSSWLLSKNTAVISEYKFTGVTIPAKAMDTETGGRSR